MDLRVTKKIVIDAYRGGEDIGNSANNIIEKDYNLEISKYIYERLKSLGIPVSLTRESDETLDMTNRINKIKSFYGNGSDVIVISNALSSNVESPEVVYALRNSNNLSSKIANELNKISDNETRFYQRRLPSDTSKDYNELIRNTANNESLIIYYGNITDTNDATFLKNNLENLGEAVVIAIADYLNIDYNPQTGSNYYTVKKGDTLYSIAKKYNTTTTELKELNNLSTNNLSIGKVLKIPTQEEFPNSNTYTVKKGDTLYKIANNYNLTVSELKKINNLTSNILSIGQVLKVGPESETNDSINYKVVSGDSLYSIAKKYNTTVDIIKSLNNLNSNLLSIGQILKIPSKDEGTNNYKTYKVVSGDNLYSIAKKYNTTVDAIKSLNNLNGNLLSIGQTLKIPT